MSTPEYSLWELLTAADELTEHYIRTFEEEPDAVTRMVIEEVAPRVCAGEWFRWIQVENHRKIEWNPTGSGVE